MRIIFMGTPEFAVASLAALVESGKEVVAVVTGPDRPSGRGQKLTQSAVKTYALEQGIPVLQPERLKDPVFIEQLRDLKADLQVVVAFRMLPEIVWNMPPRGTVNLHASLLPQYRGAAPINHVLINGETETGVTTFLLQHEIDTGHILFAEKVSVAPDETAGELHDKLMDIGAALLVKTVEALESGQAVPQPQSKIVPDEDAGLKHAPKIFKEHCRIDWHKSTAEIHNLIRGLSPYPAAFTELNGKTIKIFRSEIEKPTEGVANSTEAINSAGDANSTDAINSVRAVALPEPGTPLSDGKTFLKFATKDGYLSILQLQAEGKKKMDIQDFLRGFQL